MRRPEVGVVDVVAEYPVFSPGPGDWLELNAVFYHLPTKKPENY